MASPIPITSLSAAHTLVSWIVTYGREPSARECRPIKGVSSTGLLMYATYRRKLPGDTFSACISAARSMVSQAPKLRLQTCLGPDCEVRFLYTGAHFCAQCRAVLGYDDEDSSRNGQYLAAHDRRAAQRDADIRMVAGAGTGARYVVALTGQTLSAPTVDGVCEDDEDDRPLYRYGSERERDDEMAEERVVGFDDLIASQMNAWQRLSRKRRFFEGA